MGRARQTGFDFFPFDTTFFEDTKVRKLLRRSSPDSITVYLSALCFIFKEGYYSRIDDDFPYLISEKTKIDEDGVRQILDALVELGLFNKDLYEKGVLTSAGIQVRYLKMCSSTKRNAAIMEYNLLQDDKRPNDFLEGTDSSNEGFSDVSPEESDLQDQQMEISSGKTPKDSGKPFFKEKEKESKVNIPPIPNGIAPPKREAVSFETITPLCNSPTKSLAQRKHEFGQRLIPYTQVYGKEMIREFFDYWTESNENGRKMAFEMTRKGVFNIASRLATWKQKADEGYGSRGTRDRGTSIMQAVQASFVSNGGETSYGGITNLIGGGDGNG